MPPVANLARNATMGRNPDETSYYQHERFEVTLQWDCCHIGGPLLCDFDRRAKMEYQHFNN